MDVAVERQPVKEEKGADAKPETMAAIGSALPIVFESFQSPQRTASMKQRHVQDDGSLEAAKAEMGVVRQENERLKTMLSRVVSEYQSLQMHFVKVRDQAAAKTSLRLPEAPAALPPVVADEEDTDDLVSLSLGTRANNGGARRKGHERSSSSSGTGGGDSQLSLGLGFSRPQSTDDEKTGPVLNLSSDSSGSADDTAKHAGESRKSPSGGAGDGGGADDEVQQQAKKTRVSVRVKCDTPTMNDGCQWRKYGQKISKGNPCPRAYYRCTVAPNCPVRKQVQRCADDRSILITTYEGAHNHPLPPAATAMASTTSAAAAMLTSGSTTSSSSSLIARHHLAAGLLGPTTMVSTAASCPTITLDLTTPAGIMQSSPYTGYDSTKALPAAWSSGYPAFGGSHLPSYFAAKSSPAAMGHLFGVSRPEQLYGGQTSTSSFLQRSPAASIGGQSAAAGVAPAVTDTLAKAITSDPNFQSVLAAVITSYMGRGGGGGEAAHQK